MWTATMPTAALFWQQVVLSNRLFAGRCRSSSRAAGARATESCRCCRRTVSGSTDSRNAEPEAYETESNRAVGASGWALAGILRSAGGPDPVVRVLAVGVKDRKVVRIAG